ACVSHPSPRPCNHYRPALEFKSGVFRAFSGNAAMRKRCLIEPCLALLFAVAVPASLHAQARNGEGNPSHIEVPFHPPADGQFADFLKSRDHAAQAREIYQKLQNLFKEPDVLRKNRDTLKELLDQDEQPRRLEDLDKDELRALLERLRDRLQRAQKREVDQV